jgi:NAD(P)-dependent dehydrogenase (short-subunit alcohol dehydrogenase family)
MAADTQVAIVTGAGSGIGFATAVKLAGEGKAIVVVGRDASKLEAVKKAINAPDRVEIVAVDLTTDEAPKRVVDAAVSRFGRIDFLINNAGIGAPKPLHETDDAMLDYFLGLMLRAPFRLARDCIPHMKKGSAIINITSTFAMVGGMRGGAYSAAKGGLTSLTEHIACQYGPQGIRCNAVAPGVTITPMVEGRLMDPKFRRVNIEMTPFYRLGKPDDIAGTIAFLCSPAAGFINGQTIVVDGGWTTTKYLSPYAQTSEWTAVEGFPPTRFDTDPE